jgi:putative oxidoreductase
MMHLFKFDRQYLELGYTFIRVAIGSIFVIHGWGKLSGGVQTWQWMGSQMSHLGITFLPTFWGFMAMLTEFVGGFLLIVGLGTRLISLMLAFVMLVAISYHVSKGDGFNDVWSHPFTLLFVFIGLVLAGSGRYSLDHYLFERNMNVEMKK